MGQRFVWIPEKVARQLVEIDDEQNRLSQRSRDITGTARVLLDVPDGAQLIRTDDGAVGFVVDDGVVEGIVDEGAGGDVPPAVGFVVDDGVVEGIVDEGVGGDVPPALEFDGEQQ